MSWRIEGARHPSLLNGRFAYGKFPYLECECPAALRRDLADSARLHAILARLHDFASSRARSQPSSYPAGEFSRVSSAPHARLFAGVFHPALPAAPASLPIARRSPTITGRGINFRYQLAISISSRRGGFMISVHRRARRSAICQFGLMLAIALSTSLLPGAARAYTPEQQQACTPDAFRLCGDAIPDVDRVTVCMIRNRSQLSPGCRVYFRSPEPERAPVVTSVTVRKPVRITPVTARKPVSAKTKKNKKARQAR
jgi:hypothetical protein